MQKFAGVLWNSCVSQGKTFEEASFCERDSCKIILLWMLQNFEENDFYRTPPGDCFLKSYERIFK